MRILEIFKTLIMTPEAQKDHPLETIYDENEPLRTELTELFETMEDNEEERLTPTEENETEEG